jgi:tRNA pseudouridine38-40 synthase
MNVASGKLHKLKDISEDDMKKMINEELPKDIKVFRIIEVSRSYDAKDTNNFREYHYILPSFILEPKSLSKENNKSIDDYIGNYEYKLPVEYHDKIKELCKLFRLTHKFNNYTKKIPFTDPSASRHIYEFTCSELVEYKNFQAVKFKIVGQSFLYNQIRKMVGMIADVCRDSKDASYIENSFCSNRVDIPKAPAEGLYLYRVIYYL